MEQSVNLPGQADRDTIDLLVLYTYGACGCELGSISDSPPQMKLVE